MRIQDEQVLKYIYVRSLPRSGTNYLAWLLGTHPKIFSVNTGGGRVMPFGLKGALKSPIYPSVAKHTQEVQYLLFDEVNNKISSLNRLAHEFFIKSGHKSISICLYRNPFSQFISMQVKGKRFFHPGFNKRASNIRQFVKEWVMNYSYAEKGIAVAMEDLIAKPSENLRMIYSALSMENAEFTDLDTYITSVGCQCGGHFKQGETDEILGYFFRVNNVRLHKTEKAWICSSCSRPALGYGGFNPFKRNGDSSSSIPISRDVHDNISQLLANDIDDTLINFFSKKVSIEY